MKKLLFINVFILTLIQGCIPLNNVHSISSYEIKEGKPKARKDSKKYTKFIITNDSQHQIIIKFLEDKYQKKSFNGWIYAISKKLFLDENTIFNIRFVLETKQQRYLNLYNLFSNKSESDPTYDKNLDDPYQDGANIRYVSIIVTDDSGVDYLAKNSHIRDRLIIYLNNLKREYGIYRTNYNFINGK